MKQSEQKNLTQQQEKKFAKARVKYLRIAPRKVRIVIDAIRHKHPEKAFGILMTLKKKAARMAEKVLKTAVANAKVLGLDEARLYISDVRADGGPVMKRFMQRSMGRGDRILKRTTHLSMTLSEGVKKLVAGTELQAGQEQSQLPKAAKPEKKSIFSKKKTAAAKS